MPTISVFYGILIQMF
jgi:hypothetical protein